jgi:hypothetical protein
MRRPIFSAVHQGWSLGAFAALFLVHCLSEREILGEGEAGGGAGDGAECYEALARGTDGEPCTGSFSCSSTPRPCCTWSAVCANGSLSISEDCGDCACVTDADCPTAFWCVAGECSPCSTAMDCAFPNVIVPRNGCPWCVPLGECATDAECPRDTICYSGRACPAGCTSPWCCFGNLCREPGCGSTENLDCGLVGCADGNTCEVSGEPPSCACTSGLWTCTGDSPNACVAP